MNQTINVNDDGISITNENVGETSFRAIEKHINKHVFVWIGTFLCGIFGVDRFMRGQIGLGILKILFNWCTVGIWGIVDWIIALVKVYGSAFGDDKEVSFINGKYAK